MKKFMIVSGLLAVSSSVSAHSVNADFYAADKAPESQICLAAAQSGFAAAKAKAKSLGVKYVANLSSTMCNGVNVKKFATQQSKVQLTPLQTIVPGDETAESVLCAKAANLGLSQVRKHTRYAMKNVKCNGMPIEDFVKAQG